MFYSRPVNRLVVLSDRRTALSMSAALGVLALAVWLASGSMAPYAISQGAMSRETYVGNIDDKHFEATYLMLRGKDRSRWEWSVVLRRTLYPLLSYPFMRAMGFAWGGFVASLLLQLGAVLAFAEFAARRFGRYAAVAAAWLLATYPGITYWAGLPYSYAIIVPACLIGGILLWQLQETAGAGRIALLSLGLGVLFLGYDLLPFFAPAAVLVLLWRRHWKGVLVSIPAMLLPTLANAAVLAWVFQVPFRNKNTSPYFAIVSAWLNPALSDRWAQYIADLPGLAVGQFFFSNFLFLPAVFVAAVLLGRIGLKLRLARAEIALFVTIAAVFLFNNLAPHYKGVQLRGPGMARLYQPLLVVMILYVPRLVQHAASRPAALRALVGLVIATAALNATIAFGPVLGNPLASYLFHRFYARYPADMMLVNLDKYGRRPLGLYHGPRELTPRAQQRLEQRQRERATQPAGREEPDEP